MTAPLGPISRPIDIRPPKNSRNRRRMIMGLSAVAVFWGTLAFLLRPLWPVDPFQDDSPPSNPCQAVGEGRLRALVPDAKIDIDRLVETPTSFRQGCNLEVEDTTDGRVSLVLIDANRTRSRNADRDAREDFEQSSCAFNENDGTVVDRFRSADIGNHMCGIVMRNDEQHKAFDYSVNIAILQDRDIFIITYAEAPIDADGARSKALEFARLVATAMKE